MNSDDVHSDFECVYFILDYILISEGALCVFKCAFQAPFDLMRCIGAAFWDVTHSNIKLLLQGFVKLIPCLSSLS